MRRIFLASPWRGDRARNEAYALRCLADSLRRGEAPMAPHLLLTRVLDDGNLEARAQGIMAGLAWLRAADELAVYVDLGISEGMQGEIDRARMLVIPVEFRTIGP